MRSLLVIGALVAALSVAVSQASAATLCVGQGPGCFATIQAAVNAAHDGDTITIGVGTFQGGIVIDKSVRLVGAGAAATIVKGGGPVVTIGADGAVSEPTVSISGVTITGGLSHRNPHGDTDLAFGGGVEIPSGAQPLPGATVSISDSVVTGNRAVPIMLGDACGPGSSCAVANGGGIDNQGVLTLTNTRVTDNVAGATASSASVTTVADGGGIDNKRALTLRNSVVSGNHATVVAANGQTSNGGGIDDGGTMTVVKGVVSGNSASVSSPTGVPSMDVAQEANAGGIWIDPGQSATIAGSIISSNSVAASNTGGEAQAANGGIDDDGSLQLTSSAVDDNVATASNSGDGALALDGGIGDDGSLWLTSSSVDHNHVSVTVPDASGFTAVGVGGGLGVTGTAVVRSSRIDANDIVAAATNGTVEAGGGGMANLSGALTVEQTLVAGNHTTASGAGGDVLGGGILNIAFGGPDPQLTLTSSAVLANTLTSSGVPSLGGGIFTSDPPTIVSTVIAGNVPDQCAGDC